jgi:vitamin B12 transporter
MVEYFSDGSSRRSVLLFLLVGCIFSAQSVTAQLDSIQQLKAVTVTALVSSQVPVISPAQTIRSNDFKKLSAYNIADALRNFSGVNIKDYGGIGGLKTVSVRSLGANHTGVQYDGVPVNDMQNGQIDLGKISLDNVESITLYNGQPGDICQPAQSFASTSTLVINSLPPRLDSLTPVKVKIGFTTGSFGLIHPTLQWQQRLHQRWALRFTSYYQKAHGRYSYRVRGDGSDTMATRTNAEVKTMQQDLAIYYLKNDSTRITLRANYYHSDRGLPGAVVFYNPYTNQHLRNRDLFIQSGLDHRWSNFQLLLHGKYTHNYTRYLDPDYLNSEGKMDQRYQQQQYYVTASMSWKPLKWVDLAYSSDFLLSTLHTSTYGFAYPKRFTYLNAVSAHIKLDRVQIQSTLLNTHIHKKVEFGKVASDKTIWSPTVLATYKPFETDDFLLRVFFKDIFRAPTFNDLYYTRSGNRDLRPELAKQYNVGVVWRKDLGQVVESIQITTDVYYNAVKDKIIAVPNKDLFSWTMLNLGEVDIRGVDVTTKTQIRIFGNVKAIATANYTFQEALDVTDPTSSVYLEQIPYTPKHSMALNAGLDHQKWGVYLNQTYSSHRYYLSENLPEHYVPGFFVTDLSGLYRFQIADKLLLNTSLEINNLFGTEYAFIRSFPMPGRSYRFSIQISI